MQRLGRAAALCNDSSVTDGTVIGDSMEAALVVLAGKAGLDPPTLHAQWPRIAEVPFDARLRFMITAHLEARYPQRALLAVKGAPDALVRRCTSIATSDGAAAPMDDAAATAAIAAAAALAGRGLRVLAIAHRSLPADEIPRIQRHVPDIVSRLPRYPDDETAARADGLGSCCCHTAASGGGQWVSGWCTSRRR